MTSTDKPLPAGEKQRLLQSCKALIFKWATVHFKGYLDKVDEQLFRMADKAGSNLEQNRYLQARTELQQQRRLLEKQLLERLRLAFEYFLDQHDTAADMARADAELTLVDNDLLEQSIAVATMTRKANADCSEALYALNQRFSALGGGRKINDQGNPVAPAVFAEGVQKILAELTLDTPSKLVIYKIYDAAVMAKLGKLYHLLNHHLKNEGVLSHLRYQIRKDETPQLPEELSAQNSPETVSKQSQLMDLIQQLQARLASARINLAGAGVPGGIGGGLAAPQLVIGLQPLQQRSAMQLAAAQTQQAVLDSGYQTLPEQIRDDTRNAMPVDADMIEIVGLLFEYMLNDEQLPDSVKALLSYLHTPFLKVALLDKEFFKNPQHPARQLLNSLVAAGERWVEPEGKHKSDVYQQMKAVVQRILDEFDNDLRLFTQLAFDFNHYLRQHARRVRLAEQRAQQAARGEDRLKEVRQRVERYLQEKTEGCALPAEARTLLFEPWANFLAFNLLRFGSKSEQWDSAAAVVDDVLTYINPAQAPQRAWQLRDSLGERLRAGFATVGYEAEAGRRLLDALHRAHQDSAARPDKTPAQPPRAADIDAVPAEAAPAAKDPILEQLSALEFGTWFVFLADRPRKEQWQAKLAWSNNRTQHYMFVNRLGQQVAVRSGYELAADIRAGRARILQNPESKPFFEKALERIVEQLRRRPQRQ